MADLSNEIEAIIRDFASRLVTAAHLEARERALSAVAGAITGSLASVTRNLPTSKNAGATVAVAATRKRKLSAKGLAARKRQGQYLGLLRGLQPSVRARVKKVAQDKGVAEALKFAASLK